MIVGIDAGSSYTKVVFLKNKKIEKFFVFPTSIDYEERIRKILPPNILKIGITGYCRRMLAEKLKGKSINEIKALSVGAKFLAPSIKTLIDLGGQDCKIIKLKEDGFSDFIMNDRCAAGTGKFLEMVASRLGIKPDKLSDLSERADKDITISSMCAVFAESEIISLLARGEKPENIAKASLNSIADRISSLAKGLGITHPLGFSGGGALNKGLANLLSEKLNVQLLVLPNPQFIGAIGAAITAETT